MSKVVIKPVETKKDLMQFIKLPFFIYKDDHSWVPPLIIERKEHLSEKNPFFKHAKVQFFLAIKDDKPVGRISAHIDYLYIEHHKHKCGFFGFIEGVDDREVFKQLLNTAEEWVKNEGMQEIMGPFSFSTNDEVGLLIRGFDIPPTFMLSHSKPYYSTHLEALGYTKRKDLNCYMIDIDKEMPPFMKKTLEKTEKHIEIKSINTKELKGASQLLGDIFNDSWTNNWGFIPFTKDEIYNFGKYLKYIVEDDFANVAYYKGEPAGVIVVLPNLNEIIKDLNGKLFPTGIFKIFRKLRKRKYTILRAVLLGVRRKYHKNLLASAIVFHLIKKIQDVCLAKGLRYVDVSWVLEDNEGIIDLVTIGGGELYKVYRIYGKNLT